MTRYLVCSDIHLNLNRRFDDMVVALARVTEKVKELRVDQVLILGDVYTSRRPHPKEKEVFERWVKELLALPVDAVVIVKGNHDVYPDGTHTFHEFTVLEYPGVIVLDNPATYAGMFMGHLLLREACVGAGNVQVSDAEWTIDRLLKEYPGYEVYLLGDVHKHQFLHKDPAVVYAGSIEHVDFAERNDPKGVLLVETGNSGEQTTVKFIALEVRPMLQFDLYAPFVVEPTRTADGAIVKVIFHGTKEEITGQVKEGAVRELFAAAKELIVQYDVSRNFAPRDKQVNEAVTPEKALELYFNKKGIPEADKTAAMTLGMEVIRQCQSSKEHL